MGIECIDISATRDTAFELHQEPFIGKLETRNIEK